MTKIKLSLLALACLGWSFQAGAQAAVQKALQEQFILVEDGGTIDLPAGTHELTASLWLDGKANVTIRGAGMDKTVLSFKQQVEGAEGLKVTHARNITLEGFTVQDAKGDAIKAQEVDGIRFVRVKTAWTGKPSKRNGAYGLYPVQCTDVLIDDCEAIGASDAGIYVGQSDRVVVRNSRAYRNVAGIEIENTTNAEVYANEARDNTGGILVFDLPDLPKKKGGNVRVYNNKVIDNNYKNFAPKGNIVGQVPPGTGVMILATNDVEIYGNEISGHKTVGTGIISYYITEIPIKDEEYDPYPANIRIHSNTYTRAKQRPTLQNKIGKLLYWKFGRSVPDIIYDGIKNEAHWNPDGSMKPAYRICIQDNGAATFASLDAANKFKAISRDARLFTCQ